MAFDTTGSSQAVAKNLALKIFSETLKRQSIPKSYLQETFIEVMRVPTTN
jgi:hypothetical protein